MRIAFGLLAPVILACLANSASAQQPAWQNIPPGGMIPGTEIRVIVDNGRLKYWVENLPNGGKLVHLKDFESGTTGQVSDTVAGDGNTDNVDLEIVDDNANVELEEVHFADVTVDSGSDGTTVTLDNSDNATVTVAGDNGEENLSGDSFNNDGSYTSSASNNTHENNGTGGNNTFKDASGNAGPW